MGIIITTDKCPEIGDKIISSDCTFVPNIVTTVEKITVNKITFTRGDGSSNNPSREVVQYLDENNNLLLEIDTWLNYINKK